MGALSGKVALILNVMPRGLSIQARGLSEVQDLLLNMEGAANKVISRAINKTLKGVRTDVTEEVQKSVDLTKSFIQKQTGKKTEQTFSLHRATASFPRGTLTTRGANVPLIQYSNQRGLRQRYPKSIFVSVKKARGKHKMRHVFIPQLKSKHRGLFVQLPKTAGTTASGHRKIKQLFGPRIPDILSNKEVMERVEEKASGRIDKNLSHEVDYFFSTL